jgi:hypothetical protein
MLFQLLPQELEKVWWVLLALSQSGGWWVLLALSQSGEDGCR